MNINDKIYEIITACTWLSCIGTFASWFFNLMGTFANGISATVAIMALLINWHYLHQKDRRDQLEFDYKSSKSKKNNDN